MHLGHYMASTFNPEILIFNATMADIPLRTGYAPAQWHKGLNVMIEKTPGNFNVEKLHIILLFEANFNSNNKWLRCTFMFNAKISHLMAAEQNGSQKKKSAISQCWNKLPFASSGNWWHSVLMMPKAVTTKLCCCLLPCAFVISAHLFLTFLAWLTPCIKWNTLSKLHLVTPQKQEVAKSGISP